MKRLIQMTLTGALLLTTIGCQPASPAATTPPPTRSAPTVAATGLTDLQTPSAGSSAANAPAGTLSPALAGTSTCTSTPGSAIEATPADMVWSPPDQGSGFQFKYPRSWHLQQRGLDAFQITRPDQQVTLLVWVIDAPDVKPFLENLNRQTSHSLANEKELPATRKEEIINGLHTIYQAGTATMKKGGAEIQTDEFVAVAETKALVVMGLGDLQSEAAHLLAMRESVRVSASARTRTTNSVKNPTDASPGALTPGTTASASSRSVGHTR